MKNLNFTAFSKETTFRMMGLTELEEICDVNFRLS
jgi:hypothetical protein